MECKLKSRKLNKDFVILKSVMGLQYKHTILSIAYVRCVIYVLETLSIFKQNLTSNIIPSI